MLHASPKRAAGVHEAQLVKPHIIKKERTPANVVEAENMPAAEASSSLLGWPRSSSDPGSSSSPSGTGKPPARGRRIARSFELLCRANGCGSCWAPLAYYDTASLLGVFSGSAVLSASCAAVGLEVGQSVGLHTGLGLSAEAGQTALRDLAGRQEQGILSTMLECAPWPQVPSANDITTVWRSRKQARPSVPLRMKLAE